MHLYPQFIFLSILSFSLSKLIILIFFLILLVYLGNFTPKYGPTFFDLPALP